MRSQEIQAMGLIEIRFCNADCGDLRCTDLKGSDLSGTNLRGVNLIGADLRAASLRQAIGINARDLKKVAIIDGSTRF